LIARERDVKQGVYVIDYYVTPQKIAICRMWRHLLRNCNLA